MKPILPNKLDNTMIHWLSENAKTGLAMSFDVWHDEEAPSPWHFANQFFKFT